MKTGPHHEDWRSDLRISGPELKQEDGDLERGGCLGSWPSLSLSPGEGALKGVDLLVSITPPRA